MDRTSDYRIGNADDHDYSCERESRWLDESPYAVDLSILPRGGSRRRKSMEPRALLNKNGNLTATKGRRSMSAELAAEAKADLITTPTRWEAPPVDAVEDDCVSDVSTLPTPSSIAQADIPNTPTGFVKYDASSASPTTPSHMSPGVILVQQTCPPKQTNKGLFEDRRTSGFPITDRVEDQPDEGVKMRLEAARRKTMNWRPRVASPLTRSGF